MVVATQKLIEKLRRIARHIDDLRLSVRLLATIACVTKEHGDVLFAVETAKEHGFHRDYTAEALCIIVKTLSKGRAFVEARNVALQMMGMDTFWYAEARISIFRFSGEAEDKDSAIRAISHIRKDNLRNDARVDLEIAGERHHISKRSFNPDIAELSSVMSKLEAFVDSHSVLPEQNSAYLRLLANGIMDRIFAEIMM